MILFLLAAAVTEPRPLTDAEISDVGCVATFALIAERQRSKLPDSARWPDLQVTGRAYAGLVGARVTAASGQPREIVALAIRVAYDSLRVQSTNDAAPIDRAYGDCRARLADELATQPLPKPQ